ncbi:acetylxylan esterase [Phyllobacterium sp. UNC302MFCol5.2]|uniref:acetylxylan esterase n=1 Tax=Phyllobacterium sp. UNC302MFCol5.2 TaxID=1449065 RepID=UPI000689C0C2|nr:acetylxylan esterase [Phyllobacterium sp. UNC302MFCol5.2]
MRAYNTHWEVSDPATLRWPPSDFVDFWEDSLLTARRITAEPIFVSIVSPVKLLEVFDVTFPGFGGHPIKGWLVLPKYSKGRLPLVVHFLGYGRGRSVGTSNFIGRHPALHIFARIIAEGSDLSVGSTPDPVGAGPSTMGMFTKGIHSREDYYLRRIFVDGVRAIDLLSD